MLNSVTNSALQSSFAPIIFYVLLAWSIFWKGFGLWKSARNKQNFWFVAILILNSVGVLEIIYILFFQRDKNDPDWMNKPKEDNPILKKISEYLPIKKRLKDNPIKLKRSKKS